MARSRALFLCNNIIETKYAGGKSNKIIFNAVTPYNGKDDPEAKAFWDATPAGSIEMQVVNEEALKLFEPGKKYYVDFTPVEPESLT
jgi:hypothetical protein